ncbi:AbrB/MazE/SpoVT family DNA-binding domain-containing protein [Lentibacillus salinarum]|uniref:AbrB/MazE/SpoVT family DNA-binding domain-containing protein n=1 Tax=Lentibacillus salinarum TaxID=446820 RepID=A0ABW3ZXJ7_9BACI
MTTKVQRWGNSLAVRIPKEIAEQYTLEQGSDIDIQRTDDGIKLIPKKRKPTLDDLLSQITPENQHEEIDFGKPQGDELI